MSVRRTAVRMLKTLFGILLLLAALAYPRALWACPT
jgi:hypothetical protein